MKPQDQMGKKMFPQNKKVEQVVAAFVNKQSLNVDPNGSYTGSTTDINETPVQDADDL